MKKDTEQKVFTPMNAEEKEKFDSMMSCIRSAMDVVRKDSVRMSHEAQQAASMSNLNC